MAAAKPVNYGATGDFDDSPLPVTSVQTMTSEFPEQDYSDEDDENPLIEDLPVTRSEIVPNASIPASAFNVLNTMIGGGTVAMPYAFAETGYVLGPILLVFFAVLSGFTQNLLIHTDNLLTDRPRKRGGSYENMGVASFARKGALYVQAVEVLNTFGVLATYLVIIRDQSKILSIWLSPESFLLRDESFYFLLLITVFLILPIAMLPKLTFIVYASIPSLMCSLFTGLMVAITGFYTVASDGKGLSDLHAFKWNGVFLSMPIITLAFTSHINVFHVYKELSNKSESRMAIVSNISMASACVFYGSCGLGGYFLFGLDTQGDILKNFKDSFLPGQLARVGMLLSLMLTYPILCFPCRHAADSLLFGRKGMKKKRDAPTYRPKRTMSQSSFASESSMWTTTGKPFPLKRHICETIAIVGLSFLVANLVPSVATIYSLVGAITAANLVFIMPTAFYIKLNEGGFTWRLAASSSILVLGVGVMIGSTAVIVNGIINGTAT